MATVWAKNNGNWSATTLWAFWNETTQQIEDYNQVPQVGDVVYCNGYNISLNSSQIITCKEIHNGINPYTNNINGYIILRNGIIINADIYNDGTTYITYTATNNSGSFTINGNIYRNNNSSATCAVGGASGYIMTIVGNIEVMSNITQPMFSNSQAYPFNITVVGNVYMPNSSFSSVLGSASNCHIRIDGVCEISKPYGVDNSSPNYTFTCSGILIINSPTIAVITANKIHYRAGFNCVLSNVYPIDTATFECKYIGTEPNPNLYIIVNPNTIADTYPTEDKVLAPTQYGAQMELVGQYTPDYPPESVVLKDYEYGDEDDRKTGTMVQEVNVEVGCVTPEDVRKDVPLVGMGVVGSLVVPSVDDVREGVVFDNGSVGTLIVQGGGDRLRIADFGYYTNAQSDTYIVDLTEQDKPKFAVAEERVLIEMFPDLDLENIPDKYFDDLFVKYLKYRLIVEYYRTAGINSTFTPSEPTTEIVNYQNVRNEVWLNSANIYLKAWSKKYPESIVKPQRILL